MHQNSNKINHTCNVAMQKHCAKLFETPDGTIASELDLSSLVEYQHQLRKIQSKFEVFKERNTMRSLPGYEAIVRYQPRIKHLEKDEQVSQLIVDYVEKKCTELIAAETKSFPNS